MLTRRIVPCLDVDSGRVVKGVRFRGLRDAGDPVELGRAAEEAADLPYHTLVLLSAVGVTPEQMGAVPCGRRR